MKDPECDCCGNSFYDEWVTPSEATGVEGFVVQFMAMQRDANCYGQIYPEYSAGTPTYISADNSICHTTFGGMTMGVGSGETIINAGWTADAWSMSPTQMCDYTPVVVLRDALCAVLEPVSFIDVSEVGGTNSAEFFGSVPLTSLNISSCGGERFGIKIRFSRDFDTSISNVDSSVSSTGMFALAPSPVDGTYVEYYGNDKSTLYHYLSQKGQERW